MSLQIKGGSNCFEQVFYNISCEKTRAKEAKPKGLAASFQKIPLYKGPADMNELYFGICSLNIYMYIYIYNIYIYYIYNKYNNLICLFIFKCQKI